MIPISNAQVKPACTAIPSCMYFTEKICETEFYFLNCKLQIIKQNNMNAYFCQPVSQKMEEIYHIDMHNTIFCDGFMYAIQ
jgi:hypothetical protein